MLVTAITYRRKAKVAEKAKVTVGTFVGTVSMECPVRVCKQNSQTTELQKVPSRSNPAQKARSRS